MQAAACHPCPPEAEEAPLNEDRIRHIVLKVLGLRKVADWCSVSESAVSQWLSRRNGDAPIPPQHVPAIVAGAAAEGIAIEVAEIWPAAKGLLASVAIVAQPERIVPLRAEPGARTGKDDMAAHVDAIQFAAPAATGGA
jgi:hypothetical protein